jgi:nitroimidazol reductase NimA-like FMN-containing flavoprotein (pyridoxamine 5'-phosphate oxidase superfamily)
MSTMRGRQHHPLQTERTTLQRRPGRGAYDFETIAQILDEARYGHVGFLVEAQPYVVPTGYGRDGHTLYIHGSAASRMLRALSRGLPICLTVTLFDGLVLARSGVHHSMNYRSVMILGTAHAVEADEKLHAPVDDEANYQHACWAGELPFALVPHVPVPDPQLLPGIVLPSYLVNYQRPQRPSQEAGSASGLAVDIHDET